MSKILLLCLFVSAPMSAIAAHPVAVLRAIEDPAPPVVDKRPEIAALLDKLKAHADKKGSEDRDAISVMDQLLPQYKTSGPKDKVAIVTTIAKCFELRRDDKEGAPNNQLFLACAVALGEMGPESTKPLIAAIDSKNLKKQTAVRHRLILSLGKTKDVKDALEPLIQLLQDKDATLVGAAAEALGEFSGADLDTRKKAFEAMLKIVMSAKGAMDSNAQDTIARDRYDVVNAPIVGSLGKLSKHEERDPEKWQTWWNKNKLKNWDDPK